MVFFHDLGRRRRRDKLGQGMAQALGILLGDHDRQFQLGSGRQQPAGPCAGPLRIAHGTDEFFLDVDDQQRGLVGIDQHCLPLAWEKA
ncbi:hypothetical protein D3C71_1617080 [compost metagenome]